MKMLEDLSLAPYMTFQTNKTRPIHRWFFYKEGYAPEIVEYAVRREGLCCGDNMLLDPFCGVGTSLLAAKGMAMRGFGIDASELAVFVSKTKCANYEKTDLAEIRNFLNAKHGQKEPTIKWNFELFNPRAAFPKRNFNDILSLREEIESAHCSEKAKNLLLLALLSILPQTSIIVKDGGVLKIDKRKRAMPAREAFRRKLKQMIDDIEHQQFFGPEPVVELGDARRLNFADESFDIAVTSPPYLNNVDYSKIYGLELSLLSLSGETTKETRKKLIRSFIKGAGDDDYAPKEVEELTARLPIVGAYFADIERALSEINRVLKTGRSAYIVVSNSVIFNEHIAVDEILGQIGERLGMECEIIVGAYRIADVKPQRIETRESVVVCRKI